MKAGAGSASAVSVPQRLVVCLHSQLALCKCLKRLGEFRDHNLLSGRIFASGVSISQKPVMAAW